MTSTISSKSQAMEILYETVSRYKLNPTEMLEIAFEFGFHSPSSSRTKPSSKRDLTGTLSSALYRSNIFYDHREAKKEAERIVESALNALQNKERESNE